MPFDFTMIVVSLCSETLALLQVQHVLGLPGVYIAHFDQCQFGLESVVSKTPIKKRTSIATNSLRLYEALHGRYCNGGHTHQVIQGSEGGRKRSTAAQEYPLPLCNAICEAFLAEQRARQ